MISRLNQIADELNRIGDAFITVKMDAGGVFLTKQTAIGALLLAACKAGAFDPSLAAELEVFETQRAMGGTIWCAVYNHLAKGGKISKQEQADATGWCASCHAIADYIRIQPAQVAAAPSNVVDDDTHLHPKKLAQLFDVPQGPLESRLKRFRKNNLNGWIENPERTSRTATYLYRVGSIRPILTALKTTGKRRAKKFPT
jgi:hypothetical protein